MQTKPKIKLQTQSRGKRASFAINHQSIKPGKRVSDVVVFSEGQERERDILGERKRYRGGGRDPAKLVGFRPFCCCFFPDGVSNRSRLG